MSPSARPRLVDVRSGRFVERPVVIVQGDRIESVVREAPAGVSVLDLGDRTLLPGLIDVHTHVLLQGDAASAEYELFEGDPGGRQFEGSSRPRSTVDDVLGRFEVQIVEVSKHVFTRNLDLASPLRFTRLTQRFQHPCFAATATVPPVMTGQALAVG